VDTVHALPPYQLDRLCDLLWKIQFDFVIPCDHFAILPLNHKALPPHTKVYLLGDEAFAICWDKGKTYELAESLGIPLARQRSVSSIEELDVAAAEFGWPLVLKPASSVTPPGIRRAVRKAWNREQAQALARPPLLVQQNFIGIGVGVEGRSSTSACMSRCRAAAARTGRAWRSCRN
jgi:predicted ATP-grasp superfamily ATP-dependent carboligase